MVKEERGDEGETVVILPKVLAVYILTSVSVIQFLLQLKLMLNV